MTTRTTRALRGASFAAIATLLAAVAHTLGGGGAPSPLFCTVVAVLATPAAMLLAGPRVRAWRTWASVGASQLLFHLAFSLVGDLGAWDVGALGHVHGPAAVDLASAASVPLPSPGMLAAHAAAAALTAWLVRVGERVVLAVSAWTVRVLNRARIVLAPHRGLARPLPSAPPVLARGRVAAHPLSRRGPPRLSSAVA